MAGPEENKAPAEMPVARIVSPKEREKLVPLEYPVEYDGVLYEEIRIRRVTAQQVADFFAELRKSESFVLPPMIDCPVEVWQALDDDDQMAVDDAAKAFTPRRLKAAVKLIQEAGVNTSDL